MGRRQALMLTSIGIVCFDNWTDRQRHKSYTWLVGLCTRMHSHHPHHHISVARQEGSSTSLGRIRYKSEGLQPSGCDAFANWTQTPGT